MTQRHLRKLTSHPAYKTHWIEEQDEQTIWVELKEGWRGENGEYALTGNSVLNVLSQLDYAHKV